MFESKLILKKEPLPTGWYATDWNGSADLKEIRRDLTESETAVLEQQETKVKINEFEEANKSRRNIYLDAYRKYQAAVNYGEFERVAEVDEFITKLRNKDWAAFDDIPPQIKYFTGECGFEESGLTTVGGLI